MSETGDVINFTPTAKPREHGLLSFFLPLFCISQLERAREHQPGTSDSAGKSLFAFCFGSALLGNFAHRYRYAGVTPARATAGPSPANCNCHANAA